MIYHGINTLFNLKLPPRSLLHNVFIYHLKLKLYCEQQFNTLYGWFQKCAESLRQFEQRQWFKGTGAKIPGFDIRIPSLKNEPSELFYIRLQFDFRVVDLCWRGSEARSAMNSQHSKAT